MGLTQGGTSNPELLQTSSQRVHEPRLTDVLQIDTYVDKMLNKKQMMKMCSLDAYIYVIKSQQ